MSATLANAEQDLRSAHRRVLAAAADDLGRALLDPRVLERIAASDRFVVRERALSIDADLASLTPSARFDPDRELDVLAQERLRRAAHDEDPQVVAAELEPLWHDAALPLRAKSWLAARLAWSAERGGDTKERDTWLTRVGDDDAEALASTLLLSRRRSPAAPWTDTERAHLRRIAARCEAAVVADLAARLCEVGAPPHDLLAMAERALRRRELLQRVNAHLDVLLLAERPFAQRIDAHLLLFWPQTGEGACLDASRCVELATTLLARDDAQVLAASPSVDDGIPLAEGLLTLTPKTLPRVSYLAGPLGNALLALALALLCGGGSLFALRAIRRERDAIRVRSEFLATVTHELKTPLAGVRLVAELLADGHVQDDAERSTWLRRLEGEAARLGMLIENVLDLGRTERGEARHSPERCELAALCDDTLALVAALAERDGQSLHRDLRGPLPSMVDRQELQQVLLNLCDNARKYGAPPIEVSLVREGDSAVLRVRDHGPGVPTAERETVFERFRRGTAHAHGSVPGVGLGLHLARAIAERHGGSLRIEDTPTGACFALRLPLCVEAS